MTAIKQDLKEGVTRVAGRLSNMASNVMSSFQVRFHSISLNYSIDIVFFILFIFGLLTFNQQNHQPNFIRPKIICFYSF